MSYITDLIQKEKEIIQPRASTLESRVSDCFINLNKSLITDPKLEQVLDFISFLTIPLDSYDFLALKLACMNLLVKLKPNSNPDTLTSDSHKIFSGELYSDPLSYESLITAVSVLGLINGHEQVLLGQKMPPAKLLLANNGEPYYYQNPQLSGRKTIADLSEFSERFLVWKGYHLTTVLSKGFFDIHHEGHNLLLEFSRWNAGTYSAQGVVVDSDFTAAVLKGPDKPIRSQFDRALTIQSMNCINNLLTDPHPFNISDRQLAEQIRQENYLEFLDLLDQYWRKVYSYCIPNIVVVGPDHRDLLEIEHSRAAPHGIMTVYFPHSHLTSSTAIAARIKNS
jgi:hypothetical protein